VEQKRAIRPGCIDLRSNFRAQFAFFSSREDALEMSELTFNIADYRPLAHGSQDHARTPHRSPAAKVRSGFVLLSSNSEPREYDSEWLDTKPAVVDIRELREAHRPCPRRGKVLRFSNPDSHRVYTMPVHNSTMHLDDDPGPLVA
jgi:hypothetical protein